MTALTTREKLAILADAAKYDASCASSGAARRDSRKTGGIGSTASTGICHSYAPDGRCISLLKVLLTNYCQYDCLYCVNRVSSDVQRARFKVDELVNLTLEFYRRNYIEGLFLSSGIIRSPDYTMERMVRVARDLRTGHAFGGYIHLKTIPDADPALLDEAALYADRLSVNVELPTRKSLARLAPEKDGERIRASMGALKTTIDESESDSRAVRGRRRHHRKLTVSGQSTQMIVGADRASDAQILTTSTGLYDDYRLKRVYYSAFSPTPHPSDDLPPAPPPLAREHRLYQADWLLRYYGFSLDELRASLDDGMLDLDVDPKLKWALANRERFPVDVNRADRELLLRVPGLGTRSVAGIVAARRRRRLRYADIARLSNQVKKAKPFIETADWRPSRLLDKAGLRGLLAPPPRQRDLFDLAEPTGGG